MLPEFPKQQIPPICSFSTELLSWHDCFIDEVKTLKKETLEFLKEQVYTAQKHPGAKKSVTYCVNGKIRYFRMPKPLCRITRLALLKGNKELTLKNPHVNNLLPAPEKRTLAGFERCNIRIESADWHDGMYLSVAIEGTHGKEGAYAMAEAKGRFYGAPDRAPSYCANVWECFTAFTNITESFYTYYIPVTREMCDCDVSIYVIKCDPEHTDFHADVYLCDNMREIDGVVLDI